MKHFQDETNFNKYVSALSRVESLIVIAVRDTIGYSVGTKGYVGLKKLGLTQLGASGDGRQDHWKGYAAIIYRGVVRYEKLEEQDMTVEYATTLDGIRLEIYSSPLRSANRASIVVNGEEYAMNRRGMNFVVIDTADGSVIDSVAFDTHMDGIPCFRDEGKAAPHVRPRKRDEMNISPLNPVRERLLLHHILEGFGNYKKIKLRIVHWGNAGLWNAMESVVMEFAKEDRYDIMVIIENLSVAGEQIREYLASCGIRAKKQNEYNAHQDSPDIVIVNHPDFLSLADCSSACLRYCVPAMLINGADSGIDVSIMDMARASKNTYDKIFVDKNLYEGLCQDKAAASITELSGNPKFDLIYNKTQRERAIPKEWDKLQPRKVILWAFDHNWWMKSSAVDLYFRILVRDAMADEGIGLIIRPHRNFIYELLQHGIWTEEDFDAFKYFCKMSPNIVWDDSLDYGAAYSVADAIITDVNCGIIISALPLDKPIAVLQRFDGNRCVPHYPDIIGAHYEINSEDELSSFMEMVKRGEDPKREQRKAKCAEYVAHFDGMNGKRIKESIENDIRKIGLRKWEN